MSPSNVCIDECAKSSPVPLGSDQNTDFWWRQAAKWMLNLDFVVRYQGAPAHSAKCTCCFHKSVFFFFIGLFWKIHSSERMTDVLFSPGWGPGTTVNAPTDGGRIKRTMALQRSLPFQCKAEIRSHVCGCHSPPLRAGGGVFSVAVNFSSRRWKRSVVTCSFLSLFGISFTSLGYRRSGSGFCSAWWVEQQNWGRLQSCYQHQLDSFQQ